MVAGFNMFQHVSTHGRVENQHMNLLLGSGVPGCKRPVGVFSHGEAASFRAMLAPGSGRPTGVAGVMF